MPLKPLIEMGKDIQQALGTPAFMLMTPAEMYLHVDAFVDLANDNDAQRVASRWAELTMSLIEETRSECWETFLSCQTNDQCLAWAKTIGKQAERISQRDGNMTDALAYQLMAIYLRCRTLDDPVSVETATALGTMIEQIGSAPQDIRK